MGGSNDICAQINDMIGDLSGMSRELVSESETAAVKAAGVIASEQRRIFAKANFKRDKDKHVYRNVGGSLISIAQRKAGAAQVKVCVGFDTETLREYPELLVIEFGRPGKSPQHSGDTDKLGRKKGSFPEAATVMPIRVGFELAKEKALQTYADDMLGKAGELFK